MLWSVTETRFVTDSTDSIFSFAAGDWLTSVWRASVSRDPPCVFLSSCADEMTNCRDSTPSGMIENPQGRIWMLLGSCPAITSCVVLISTGAYTTTDSYEFVQLSCSTHVLFSLDFTVWNFWGDNYKKIDLRFTPKKNNKKFRIYGSRAEKLK